MSSVLLDCCAHISSMCDCFLTSCFILIFFLLYTLTLFAVILVFESKYCRQSNIKIEWMWLPFLRSISKNFDEKKIQLSVHNVYLVIAIDNIRNLWIRRSVKLSAIFVMVFQFFSECWMNGSEQRRQLNERFKST